ncbi:MAG: nucleoside hydrolase [Anaerolineales bacterium]|nr:nucleoside hydrolase [Anaerolineales bacterium]
MPPIPLILDTDIGGDIDDAWALALLLKSPEFDPRLILTGTGNTHYRAAVAAKYLQAGGRTELPIGIGLLQDTQPGPQAEWLGDYQLADYPGPLYEDGIGHLIELLMNAPEPPVLCCLGPATNLREALRREPRLAGRARVVGMFGSLRRGYDGSAEVIAEYNVRADPAACQALFEHFPGSTITPLDTCGTVTLAGPVYQRILACRDPLIQALVASYRSWARQVTWVQVDPEQHSSVLFDTVAIYLALAETWLEIETLGLVVDAAGYTHIDPAGVPVRCATHWRDAAAFEDWLVGRLTS